MYSVFLNEVRLNSSGLKVHDFGGIYPAKIYLFKVNHRNTRKRSETCPKLTIKTPERRQWRRPFNDVVLVFLMLILNIFHAFL